MLDIVEIADGKDIGIQNSAVGKAANVLSVQLGSLEYAPDFGVDLRFFMQEGLQFPNESFKAYLTERLTQSQIVVSQVLSTLETFFEKYTFYVGDANDAKGFIR